MLAKNLLADKQRTDDIIQVDSLNAESEFGEKNRFFGGNSTYRHCLLFVFRFRGIWSPQQLVRDENLGKNMKIWLEYKIENKDGRSVRYCWSREQR
jgi:hypothetical protein